MKKKKPDYNMWVLKTQDHANHPENLAESLRALDAFAARAVERENERRTAERDAMSAMLDRIAAIDGVEFDSRQEECIADGVEGMADCLVGTERELTTEREAHAATRRMVDELSMRGTRANFDTARELHETTKELSACIARADAAEAKIATFVAQAKRIAGAHARDNDVHGEAAALYEAIAAAFTATASGPEGGE